MSDPNKRSVELVIIIFTIVAMGAICLAGFAWEAGSQMAWLMFDSYKESIGIPLG